MHMAFTGTFRCIVLHSAAVPACATAAAAAHAHAGGSRKCRGPGELGVRPERAVVRARHAGGRGLVIAPAPGAYASGAVAVGLSKATGHGADPGRRQWPAGIYKANRKPAVV